MTSALTILIADDHPLFRGALRQAVAGLEPAPNIVEASDFDSARRAAAENPESDMLLLDLTMPGMNGLSGLMSLRAEYPGLAIIVVSASDDQATIQRVFDLGASGFIPKSASAETIRDAVKTVAEGGIAEPESFDARDARPQHAVRRVAEQADRL
jgi:DNA-binding NarL/FixJ family response regulator